MDQIRAEVYREIEGFQPKGTWILGFGFARPAGFLAELPAKLVESRVFRAWRPLIKKVALQIRGNEGFKGRKAGYCGCGRLGRISPSVVKTSMS